MTRTLACRPPGLTRATSETPPAQTPNATTAPSATPRPVSNTNHTCVYVTPTCWTSCTDISLLENWTNGRATDLSASR
eukprot:2911333-Pyramimonas_sp.AAC.1